MIRELTDEQRQDLEREVLMVMRRNSRKGWTIFEMTRAVTSTRALDHIRDAMGAMLKRGEVVVKSKNCSLRYSLSREFLGLRACDDIETGAAKKKPARKKKPKAQGRPQHMKPLSVPAKKMLQIIKERGPMTTDALIQAFGSSTYYHLSNLQKSHRVEPCGKNGRAVLWRFKRRRAMPSKRCSRRTEAATA